MSHLFLIYLRYIKLYALGVEITATNIVYVAGLQSDVFSQLGVWGRQHGHYAEPIILIKFIL